jgi:hypothetical protein
MFFKLCKYEFKSILRTLVPIYLAVIAVSFINMFMGVGSLSNGYYNNLMQNINFGKDILELFQAVSTFAYFGVMVALSVLTLIVIIQRFYKGLLCDEGYLMFTLPVKPWVLIAAKGTIASGVTAGISILMLLIGALGPVNFFDAVTSPQLWVKIGQLFYEVPSWPLLMFEVLVLIIVSGFSKLFHLYFSMSLGHLANRHRILMSVVAYIAISMILSFISGFFMIVVGNVPFFQSLVNSIDLMSGVSGTVTLMHLICIASIILSVIQSALFFLGSERILSKHLNLE